MRIVILGAGRVGASVAESLVSEQNDITIVDTDAARLAELQDRLDLRTVVGNGAQPSVLREAGTEDADMVIATTPSDETNLVACHLAAQVFNVPTRIARVRSPDFQDHPELVGEGAFSVDHLIVPEHTVTESIVKLVEFPEALQVLEFAGGRVCLIAMRAYAGGQLVQRPIREIRAHIPNVDSRIVAIFRGESTIAPDGDTMIEPGDEVFIVAASEHIRSRMHRPRMASCSREIERPATHSASRPSTGWRASRRAAPCIAASAAFASELCSGRAKHSTVVPGGSSYSRSWPMGTTDPPVLRAAPVERSTMCAVIVGLAVDCDAAAPLRAVSPGAEGIGTPRWRASNSTSTWQLAAHKSCSRWICKARSSPAKVSARSL